MFSREICEIFKNNYLEERLRTTASSYKKALLSFFVEIITWNSSSSDVHNILLKLKAACLYKNLKKICYSLCWKYICKIIDPLFVSLFKIVIRNSFIWILSIRIRRLKKTNRKKRRNHSVRILLFDACS